MAEYKGLRSLTSKLLTVVCIALIVAIASFWILGTAGNAAVNHWLLSEKAVDSRLKEEVKSFRAYIIENRMKSTDIDAIGRWNREHRYTQLTISGLNATVKSDVGGAELVATEYGFVIRSENSAAAREYPVSFLDGVYPVMLIDRSETRFMDMVNWLSLLTACVMFLAVILVYNRAMIRTIQTLNRQVRRVSRGDLNMAIVPFTRDEIGQLAMDVNTMRLSIIEKLQKEEEAWQANSQLITAISHDVRTPLTALMGYLEILSDESITAEQRQTYMEICKNHAQRLKSLTDELFRFFLVFGKPEPDKTMERVHAATLFNQIVLEHEIPLSQEGFQLSVVHKGEQTGEISVDVEHVARIFDNLFSNIIKYANSEFPINLLIEEGNGRMTATISNHVKVLTNRVESNGIGLQTCKKLMHAMNGTFLQERQEDQFVIELSFPLISENTAAKSSET